MARFVTAVCVLMMASSSGAGSLLSSSQGSNIWNFWSSSNSNSYSVSSGCKNGCQLDKMVSSCPVDVMFLLDGSDSIPPLAFMQARDYVVNQIRNVTSLFQGSDVGVLLFSDGVHEELPLKSRTKADLDTLVSQVLNFKQPRKRTSLPATLRRARRALTDYAAPPLVPGGSRGKMIVLVSDGCLDDLRAVEQEGIQAALDRVYVLSVAISKAYLPILTRISVQVIEQRTPIDWGNTVACPATFLPPLPPGAVCSDFVLAMDGSDSVRNWEGVMRDYLAYMSNRYDGVKNAIGVVVFGSNVTTQATDTVVPPTSDTKWLLEQIKTHLRFPDDGGTGTDAAIRASTALLTSLGRNARKSIIVVTDGPALNPESARQALADAVALGFGVVVVGVGDVLSQSDLQTMAGPQSTILQIPSYLELFPLDLDSVLCGSPGPTTGCPLICNLTHVLNPTACVCEPRIGVCSNTCPTNQVTNDNTCKCVCSQTLSCGARQVFDQNTCSCVCRQTPNCGANQYFDQNTCGCVCRQTMNCGNNQNFDQNTCSCVCNNNGAPCPFNQQRNPTTCLCECLPTTCPTGQVLSPTACQCQCPNNQPPCPQNMRRNIFSCQCECNPASCPNQIQDKNTCLCGCPPATPCRAGQVINPNTCQCVCPPSAPCPSGQVWNPNSCQCECPASASAVCQGGQVLNSNCQCVCPNSAPCPNSQFRNPSSCQCVCIPTSCPNGQIQDLNTCQCVCPPSGPCPSGQVRNSNSCQCGCPTSIACKAGQVLNSNCQCVCIQTLNCGTNQYFDQNTCGCVCRQTLSCGASQNFDQNTCSCVCPNNTPCPNGQYRSPNTCQCVCPLNAPCPSGQVRNPSTCQCVCNLQCSNGGQPNSDCTQCICTPPFTGPQCITNRCLNSPTCNALQQQDPINCQCNCINTLNCPSGTTFDTNTCTCKCLNTVNCPSGTTFDTRTCTCINNVCPNTVSCGIGSIFDPSKCACVPFCDLTCVNGVPDGACRQCLCNPGFTGPFCDTPVSTDTPKEKCPPQQTKCQNGQLAYRDCKGRCVCACDERQYTGIYCEFRVEPQLCDNCTYQNGNYLAPVKGRCDMFVVCQPLDAQLTRYDARIQFCPAGTLFQRRGTQLGCFHTGEGVCPLDPCQTLPVGSKYGHSRECGRYFECQSGSTARLMCCPEGQGFNPTTAQCEPDSNCPNTCAGNFTSCTIDGRKGLSCPYQTREDNRQLFYHTAAPGANYTCGARQIFNTTSCVCEDDLTQGCKPTIDYNFNSFTPNNSVSLRSTSGGNKNTGYFDGSARIVILRFAGSGFYTPYLGINLRVKLNGTSGSGQMAILTNADCGVSESLAITVDNSNVYFKIQAEGASRPQVLSVPYSAVPDGWLDLSLRYERQQGNLYRLTGTVNGRSDSADINGVIGTRECALQIGHGLNYSNLIGFVDDFQIWMCK